MKVRKVPAVLASLGLAAGALAFAAPASAAPTEVWVVNAFSYNNTASFDLTVCVDGEAIASLATTELSEPTTLESGDHLVEVFDGLDTPCDSDIVAFTGTLTFPESESTTLMVYWGDGTEVSVFADDLTCTEAGTARLLVRNGAQTWDDGYQPLNAIATDPNGQAISLAALLPIGEEQVTVQDPGTYTDLEVTPQYDPDPFEDVTLSEGVVTALYFYGGGDGPVGSFTQAAPVGVCEPPTTTTTSASTTTTTAAQRPISVAPRYAG